MNSAPLSDRVTELEERMGALKLGDLPLAALLRKLETDWQPDPASLFGDFALSVRALDVRLAWGTLTAGTAAVVRRGGNVDFTTTHPAVGEYAVAFSAPLPRVPNVLALPDDNGVAISWLPATVTGFTLRTRAAGVLSDAASLTFLALA